MVLLFVLIASMLCDAVAVGDTCRLRDDFVHTILEAHNKLRAAVATKQLKNEVFKNLQGTRSLFKMRYSRSDEALATATIADDCTPASLNIPALDRAQNFHTFRLTEMPKDLRHYYGFAVEEWTGMVKELFDKNATFRSGSATPFANMIYSNTFTVGCAHKFCMSENKLSLSCVYGARPKVGRQLYTPNSNDTRGCTSDLDCRKILPNSVCETATQNFTTGKGPLCDLDTGNKDLKTVSKATSSGTPTTTITNTTTLASKKTEKLPTISR